MNELKGKRALVTGASRGISAGIALALAEKARRLSSATRDRLITLAPASMTRGMSGGAPAHFLCRLQLNQMSCGMRAMALISKSKPASQVTPTAVQLG
jgi:NAD(P)-dependent dehydrogenase (short-subunit alcohol dehydrogenase family)